MLYAVQLTTDLAQFTDKLYDIRLNGVQLTTDLAQFTELVTYIKWIAICFIIKKCVIERQ
jgi:hypothetical protein